VATGASAKYLGIPSEETYANRGVSACAVCDGYFYRGKDVAVVGAGDSAAEESTYLSKLCTKVHLIVRRDEMRASKIMQQRVMNTPNIEIHWNTETDEILGDDSGVTGVRLLDNKTGRKSEIC
jgi:thioredoxin reductase (NADPH)